MNNCLKIFLAVLCVLSLTLAGCGISFATHPTTEAPTEQIPAPTASQATEPGVPPMTDLGEPETTEPGVPPMTDLGEPDTTDLPYLLKIQRADQSIFSEPHYDSRLVGVVEATGTYTITEEVTDDEGILWGRLKSGLGWVDITDIRAFAENPSPITANFADNTLLESGNFHLCIADTAEGVTRIAFRATQALTDVALYEIVFTETFDKGDLLYSLPLLTPDKPLVADLLFAGDMSMYGITFTDSEGNICSYILSVSGRNGTLILSETDS